MSTLESMRECPTMELATGHYVHRVHAESVAAEADARIAALEHAGRMALRELEDVLASCNAEKVHFDGDDFHEALRVLSTALATQPQGRDEMTTEKTIAGLLSAISDMPDGAWIAPGYDVHNVKRILAASGVAAPLDNARALFDLMGPAEGAGVFIRRLFDGSMCMYCRPEEATPSQPVAAEATDDERFLIQLREWSVRMWREEVEHRPLVNIHRARLDATWRTVMQRAGLVPNEVVGPAALAAPVEVQASPWLDGDVAKKIADENFVSYEVVQIIARALAGRPAPAAELEPVAMYRGACVDGSRCLHGCHSNEPCYYTRQAAPLSEVDTPHIPIRDLLRIYEACNGDWCSIAREVERRTIDALRPTPSNEQG